MGAFVLGPRFLGPRGLVMAKSGALFKSRGPENRGPGGGFSPLPGSLHQHHLGRDPDWETGRGGLGKRISSSFEDDAQTHRLSDQGC